MALIDIIKQAWAIVPNRLAGIDNVIKSHMAGEKLNLKKMEASILDFPGMDKKTGLSYDILNRTALIPVQGVLAKRPGIFERLFFGAISMENIKADFLDASVNPNVDKIILLIDSPGGTVDGTEELASAVFAARGTKKIIAYSDGMICSGAYWLGAAADKIYISGNTVTAGSIGVVATHVDYSEMDKKAGMVVTEVYSGKFKRLVSQNKPLSEEGKNYLQDQVDYIYSIFVSTVANYRGVSIEKVLSDMADGKIFIGEQAIKAGLVDGVSTLDGLINMAPAGVAGKNTMKAEDDMPITLESLKKENPEIYNAAFQEGKKSVEGTMPDAVKAVEAERERMKSVKEQLQPGYESLIDAMMFDGKSTAGDAAVAINQAEKKKKESMLGKLNADKVDPLPGAEGGASGTEKPEDKKDFDALVKEHSEKNGCTRAKSIIAIAKEHPEKHREWINKVNKREA